MYLFRQIGSTRDDFPKVSPTDENIDGFTPVHLAAKVIFKTNILANFLPVRPR